LWEVFVRKKIAIIGTVGLPATYGGWETLVDHLTRHLSETFDINVFCSSKRYDVKLSVYNGATLQYINLDANGIQSIPYDLVSIVKSLRVSDTLLILGVSGCVFLPFVKLFSNKKIIVNIDGLEWKRAKWGRFAKWFLKISEAVAVRFADITIADNKEIQRYVETEYGVSSQLIAYGGDHVTYGNISENILMRYPFLAQRYAFKVCRIEPENNLDMILGAFEEFTGVNLVMVGNWSNSDYGKELKLKYERYSHIYLLDPIYEQDTLNQLRGNCYVYLHGHSAGGTNPSLVEAMYLGLPVIAYSVAYNRETTYDKAKYFGSKDELIKILQSIKPGELEMVADNLKCSAVENYSWAKIATKYASLF
jgi:glycosyltransferase involved in cell wall biosynthesis